MASATTDMSTGDSDGSPQIGVIREVAMGDAQVRIAMNLKDPWEVGKGEKSVLLCFLARGHGHEWYRLDLIKKEFGKFFSGRVEEGGGALPTMFNTATLGPSTSSMASTCLAMLSVLQVQVKVEPIPSHVGSPCLSLQI